MSTLILLRHGQSVYNQKQLFTGWLDVDLTEQGKKEAKEAGEKLKGYLFDHVFTSVLKRAIETADIVLKTTGQTDAPITRNEALNERHYGDLQGLNKDATRKKFGEEQVHIWRRSYDTPPPKGESLKNTVERVLPYYNAEIFPLLKGESTVLVAAHGNSLRGLIKHLENLSAKQVVSVEIPTGVPIVYQLNSKGEIESKNVL